MMFLSDWLYICSFVSLLIACCKLTFAHTACLNLSLMCMPRSKFFENWSSMWSYGPDPALRWLCLLYECKCSLRLLQGREETYYYKKNPCIASRYLKKGIEFAF
ncbi:hypothetical protein AAFF_G00349480, partial [Aldrovandia affinis]